MAAAAGLGGNIAACVKQALSDSLESQLKALQTLSSITRVSPQNRTVVAQTDGAILSILSLMKSSTPQIQNIALSIFFNLSLNPDLKHHLADLDTIYHLNSLITSTTSPELSKLASSIVCSLSLLDKNKAKFGVASTVQTLVKVIASDPGPVSHHYLSSLAELVQFHGNCTLAVRASAVPLLIQVMDSTDGEDLSGTSLSILGLLARFDEGLNALRNMEQIVCKLVNVLKGRCMLSKEGAAEILWRLFDESEDCIKEAVRLEDFSVVLADLSVRGSTKAREKAGLLLKKIIEANLDSYGEDNNNPLFL